MELPLSTASPQETPKRTVEEIDAEIARLKIERARVAGAKWLKLIPADAGAKLLEMAQEAASGISGNYAEWSSDPWEIAPGVSLMVTYDTNVEEPADF